MKTSLLNSKTFLLISALSFQSPLFAANAESFPTSVPFTCPEPWGFAPTWLTAVQIAGYNLSPNALNDERGLAYNHFYKAEEDSTKLMSSDVKIGEVTYDLVLTRDNYYFDEEFADAEAVLFQQGTSFAVATIRSSTLYSQINCKSLVAPTQFLAPEEFLALSAEGPQAATVTVRDVPYQNFTLVSETLAYAENEKNEFIQFVPVK